MLPSLANCRAVCRAAPSNNAVRMSHQSAVWILFCFYWQCTQALLFLKNVRSVMVGIRGLPGGAALGDAWAEGAGGWALTDPDLQVRRCTLI
jgi:hypothetical protein